MNSSLRVNNNVQCALNCYSLGADITDYFNYGFTEDTWKQYCEKQRRMRMELQMPKKIFVSLLVSIILKAVQELIFMNGWPAVSGHFLLLGHAVGQAEHFIEKSRKN